MQVGATAAFWAGTHRDATVLEPAQQLEPAELLAPAQELALMGGVEWVHHQVPGWEQAALVWPADQDDAAGDAA